MSLKRTIKIGFYSTAPFAIMGIACISVLINYSDYKQKRDNQFIQRNYIPPSRVYIKSEDIDNDKRLESIIKVDNKQYLLMYDNNKNPVIVPYYIIPSYVNPAKLVTEEYKN